MHRGNVAGDGTKANFHLFKLGWRESERKRERKLWCFENDNNNLKVSLRRECAPLTVPHPLLFCPLPLNTTAQWLSRTRWAICVWWGLGGRGSSGGGGGGVASQITPGTNTKMMRIKSLIIFEIRWLLWTHRGMILCKDDISHRWYIEIRMSIKDSWIAVSHSLSFRLCSISKWRTEAVLVTKLPLFFSPALLLLRKEKKERAHIVFRASLMHITTGNDGHYIPSAFKMI